LQFVTQLAELLLSVLRRCSLGTINYTTAPVAGRRSSARRFRLRACRLWLVPRTQSHRQQPITFTDFVPDDKHDNIQSLVAKINKKIEHKQLKGISGLLVVAAAVVVVVIIIIIIIIIITANYPQLISSLQWPLKQLVPGTGKAGDHNHRRLQRAHLPVPAVISGFAKGKRGLVSEHVHSWLACCN